MASFRVCLFGRFGVERDGLAVEGLESAKAQELLGYILLHRATVHSRNALASLLWGDSSDAHAKRNLRQLLWQIQSALDSKVEAPDDRLLRQDVDRVSLNPAADLWLDVAELEHASGLGHAGGGEHADWNVVPRLKAAIDLYQGDLLEGCYQDWCVYERERLQLLYIGVLDRLIALCLSHREYGDGLAYGRRILLLDPARERTHRQLMRLHYLAGDRTAALRQYARCMAILRDELAVSPAKQTRVLYEQIRLDSMEHRPGDGMAGADRENGHRAQLSSLILRLKDLHSALVGLDQQILRDIEALDRHERI